MRTFGCVKCVRKVGISIQEPLQREMQRFITNLDTHGGPIFRQNLIGIESHSPKGE